MVRPAVAVIGSFRQHYDSVRDAIAAFREELWSVASPVGSEILEPGIDFVRFQTDPASASDEYVQSITLEKILQADLVFVVCPGGYIGRTTCYEVGRVRQCGIPLYFSDQPRDLPIHVPARNVLAPGELVKESRFYRLEEDDPSVTGQVERRLLSIRESQVKRDAG